MASNIHDEFFACVPCTLRKRGGRGVVIEMDCGAGVLIQFTPSDCDLPGLNKFIRRSERIKQAVTETE